MLIRGQPLSEQLHSKGYTVDSPTLNFTFRGRSIACLLRAYDISKAVFRKILLPQITQVVGYAGFDSWAK